MATPKLLSFMLSSLTLLLLLILTDQCFWIKLPTFHLSHLQEYVRNYRKLNPDEVTGDKPPERREKGE
jgi:hypothetical protein